MTKIEFEKLANLADDIEFPIQYEEKLYEAYKKNTSSIERKRFILKKRLRMAAAAVIAITLLLSSAYYLRSPELVVYAAKNGQAIKLSLNEEVYLEKEKTPLGEGYVLELDLEGGRFNHTIETDENQNLANIFRNENQIIWMPDGMFSMNFRDQNGNMIHIPGVNQSKLNVKVCRKDGREKEHIILIFEKLDEKCSVKMITEE